MKHFATLYEEILISSNPEQKQRALTNYLKMAREDDRLWAIGLLSKFKPKRIVSISTLKSWCIEFSEIPEWLFEESSATAGNTLESVSLILPKPVSISNKSLATCVRSIMDQNEKRPEEIKRFVLHHWSCLIPDERHIFNKLITGGFKTSLSQKIITAAIAELVDADEYNIAYHLQGAWSPVTSSFTEYFCNNLSEENLSKPYPFLSSDPLEKVSLLGSPDDWLAEWKWPGIRCQIIKKGEQIFIWTKQEELITNQFQEFNSLSELNISDFVIDGQLLIFRDGSIKSSESLQKRLGRRTVHKRLIQEYPATIFAYDLLDLAGKDIREQSLEDRRQLLESLIININDRLPGLFLLSDEISFTTWSELMDRRSEGRLIKAEGVLLKSRLGTYQGGHNHGLWWKWKFDPFNINVVLIYVQGGQGWQTNQFVDFSFAVYNDHDHLVPIAKITPDFSADLREEIALFVRNNTIERFGPVLSVKPELIFEMSFEGVRASSRRKSGIILLSPVITAFRGGKSLLDTGRLRELKNLIQN